jgi:alpha-beta hydrolase superfamily lysophospholipase
MASMTVADKPFARTRRLAFIGRFLKLAMAVLIGALLTIAIGNVLYAMTLPELRPWHTTRLKHEFNAGQAKEGFGFADYRAQEARLFEEVAALQRTAFDPDLDSTLSRFAPDGSPYRKRVEGDWNRSYLLQGEPGKGVALMVHGLSDSPYSLRSTALALNQSGMTVYGLRLPGHGTLPSGLDSTGWRDWQAAVDLVVAQIRRDHPGSPFWIVGYSTGATLALKYAADSVRAGRLDQLPRRLILMSPAIGVSPFAPLANVQRIISDFGIADRARWGNVDLELDPYKYASFAQNGAAQVGELCDVLAIDLARLEREGLMEKMPPITAFQSVVDATVVAPDLVTRLFSRLRRPGSELILFDLNRISGYGALVRMPSNTVQAAIDRSPRRDYRLTFIGNVLDQKTAMARTTEPGQSRSVDTALPYDWPDQVFSLSHMAIPFALDDPIYGLKAPPAADGLISLGAMAVRGEKGIFAVSSADQLRMKSNPFFGLVKSRILETIDSDRTSR